MRTRHNQDPLDSYEYNPSPISNRESQRETLALMAELGAMGAAVVLPVALVGGAIAIGIVNANQASSVENLANKCVDDSAGKACVAIDVNQGNGSIFIDGSMKGTSQKTTIPVGQHQTMTIDRVDLNVGKSHRELTSAKSSTTSKSVELTTSEMKCPPNGTKITADLIGHYEVGGVSMPVSVHTTAKSDGYCGSDSATGAHGYIFRTPTLDRPESGHSYSDGSLDHYTSGSEGGHGGGEDGHGFGGGDDGGFGGGHAGGGAEMIRSFGIGL